MAVTAKFQDDFNSFIAESQRAEAALGDVTQGADKTAAALSKLGGGSTSLRAITDAVGRLGSSLDVAGGGAGVVAGAFDDVAASGQTALSTFGAMREGLNDVATGAGLTIGELGLLESGLLAVGAAVAGWKIGRAIADLTGLDKIIGTSTMHSYGLALAVQEAAAKGDVLTLASQRAGRSITDFSEAMRVNQAFVDNLKARGQELADTFARINAPKEFSDQIASWHAELQSLSDAGVLSSLKAGLDSGVIGVKELSDSYRVSVGAVQLFKKELADEEKEHAKAEAAVRKHNAELARHEAQQARLEAQYQKSVAALQKFENNIGLEASLSERLTKNLRGLGAELPVLDLHTSQFGASSFVVWDGIRGGVEKVNDVIGLMPDLTDQAREHIEQLTKTQTGMEKFGSILESSIGGLNGIFQRAFEGGGGVGGAIKSTVTDVLGKSLNFVPLIGPALSQFAGAFTALGEKLFGGLFADPEKKINPLRQAFVDAAGGLDALNKHAAEAGLTLDHLLNAKNAQQYQGAIDELNGAFKIFDQHTKDVSSGVDAILTAAGNVGAGFPAALAPALSTLAALPGLTDAERESLNKLLGKDGPDFAKLTETAKTYGLSLEDLGPSFQQADLSGRADKVVSDFQALTGAGADADKVLHGMAGSIDKLVLDALHFGGTLPTALEPLVKQLLLTGQLTDEDGKKITDISGITFSDKNDPLAKSLETLTKALDHLSEILGKLPSDAQQAALGIGGAFSGVSVEVPVHFSVDDAPDFGGAQRMASGGMGRVTKPTLFLAGEAGAEDFAFSGAGKSFSGASQVSMSAMLEELRALRQDLPRAMRDAILLAN